MRKIYKYFGWSIPVGLTYFAAYYSQSGCGWSVFCKDVWYYPPTIGIISICAVLTGVIYLAVCVIDLDK